MSSHYLYELHVTDHVESVVSSAGHPIDAKTRAAMEQRFGEPMGDVRLHTDAAAAQSAHALSVFAYALGRHIVFGPEGLCAAPPRVAPAARARACPNGFSDAPEERIRTMIHEAAHLARIGAASLGESHCVIFDCENSCGGFDSADSWAQFVRCLSGQAPDQPQVIQGQPGGQAPGPGKGGKP